MQKFVQRITLRQVCLFRSWFSMLQNAQPKQSLEFEPVFKFKHTIQVFLVVSVLHIYTHYPLDNLLSSIHQWLFRILFYSWISPLLSLGYKKVLEEDDLYEPILYEKARYLTDKLEKYISMFKPIQRCVVFLRCQNLIKWSLTCC